MIACLDVAYVEPNVGHDSGSDAIGVAACLIFEDWSSEKAVSQYVAQVSPICEYIPGEFYKRELPPILKVLSTVKETVGTIVVDGYVQLSSTRAGLGAKLFEEFDQTKIVVGVAKKSFIDNNVAIEEFRGNSIRPLYVSAMGMPIDDAARKVQLMHGANRLPTLLKQVDRVVRDAADNL